MPFSSLDCVSDTYEAFISCLRFSRRNNQIIYGHATLDMPDLVWSQKLSRSGLVSAWMGNIVT